MKSFGRSEALTVVKQVLKANRPTYLAGIRAVSARRLSNGINDND